MSAIITDPFKKQFMQNVFDEVKNLTARYYIGIGKNDQWDSTETVPAPTDTPRTIRQAQAALQSVKAVAGASYVIPRVNWSSGEIYDGYDDDVTAIPTNSYYVLTEDNQVYICLQQSKDGTGTANKSTVKPTGTTNNAFKTADGYTWKFLYALSASNASSFLSANFVPIQKIDSAGAATNTIETQQASVQDSAVAGRILNIVVTNPGTGYTGTPTVTITGNSRAIGDSAQVATVTPSGGAVTKIDMLNESAGGGKNFINATVTITGGGGTGATARAVIGPPNGIGADPRDELKATSLMFNAKPSGTEGGDFLAGSGQDFRQVMLIRNPKDSADVTLTANTAKALKFVKTDVAFVNNLSIDELIFSNTVPAAKAYVNQKDSDKIFYHQTDSTGHTPFGIGNVLEDEQGNTGTISHVSSTDSAGVINTSGDVLYIENRAPVVRDASQTEDIKVVVTL